MQSLRFVRVCRAKGVEGELEAKLQAFFGPDVKLEDAILFVTADGASSNKFDGMDWITVAVCACHRLSTVIGHVFNRALKDHSPAALALHALIEPLYDLADHFRSSPKMNSLLLAVQKGKVCRFVQRRTVSSCLVFICALIVQTINKTDAAGDIILRADGTPTLIPVTPVGFISTPRTRWLYDVLALRRIGRLLPYISMIDLNATSWDAAKRASFVSLLDRAKAAWAEMVPVFVLLWHISEWQLFMQSRTTPTITILRRMLRDLRTAAGTFLVQAHSLVGINDLTSLFRPLQMPAASMLTTTAWTLQRAHAACSLLSLVGTRMKPAWRKVAASLTAGLTIPC